MSEIRVTVTDQALALQDSPLLASGGVEENIVKFDFDSTWDGLIKVAVFYQDKEHVYRQIVGADNSCTVPQEVTATPGTMYFGVFGAKDDKILTSEVCRYRIVQGAITEDTVASDPTPDIYAQMLQIYNTLKTDFSSMLAKLGKKSAVSDERHITTFWQSLEYISKYMDTTFKDLLEQAIANSSTQGIIDLINESVIPKFAEVKNKIETEATAVKNEILDNKALMYLQAAQISPNTYQMNEKRFLEFINIKECRDLYISDYSALDNKLLSPAVRLKVAGNLLNLICGTSMFLDVNGKVNDTSNNYSNPNHYEKFMYNTVSKIKKLYGAHKNFIERQKLDKLHYVSPLVTKRYTTKKLTASTTDTATVTYNGRGLLLGCFAHHSSNINDWYNFRGVAFPNGSTGSDKPLSIKSILVDGVAPQKIPYIDTGDFRINNSLEFNSSIQVIFSGSGYSENVYGGIAIMPY